jgi:hypothetical protein
MLKVKMESSKFEAPKIEEPKSITVGVLRAITVGDRTVAQIAMDNELGTRNIPARPFLKQASERIRDKVMKDLMLASQGKKSYSMIALYCETEVKKEILDGDFTPNAPSTIKAKGSSKPLINHGILLKTIEGAVVD